MTVFDVAREGLEQTIKEIRRALADVARLEDELIEARRRCDRAIERADQWRSRLKLADDLQVGTDSSEIR